MEQEVRRTIEKLAETGLVEAHGAIKRAEAMALCRITKDQAYKLLNRLKNDGEIMQK